MRRRARQIEVPFRIRDFEGVEAIVVRAHSKDEAQEIALRFAKRIGGKNVREIYE